MSVLKARVTKLEDEKKILHGLKDELKGINARLTKNKNLLRGACAE